MDRIKSYITKLTFLITVLCGFAFTATVSFGQDAGMDDSVLVRELLVMDTVKLDIFGPSNDVRFYMNGLVFLSNSKYHQKMIPDHITFGQVTSYFAPLEYISLESSRPLFSNDPFPYSPAGTSYTRDYQVVYFTKEVEISGKRKPEKIFEMSIVNGEASNYNQLSFTAGPTRYMHPAISADGEFMVFASDLVPSSGGLDLFMVRKTTGGWTTPVNLGADINTSGHEWYPFLDQHNNLFFSSSGHMGFGGYDVYVCFFNGNGWDEPHNMTNLINSSKDEIGFSIHPNRKMAIFSTTTEEPGLGKEILKLQLNNKAFVLAGIDTKNQDLSLLLQDMIETGYTSAKFGAASEIEVEAGFSLSSLPLISEEETEGTEPEAGQGPVAEAPQEPVVTPVAVPLIQEPEPEPEPEPVYVVAEPEPEPVLVVAEPEPEPEPEVLPAKVQPEPEPEPAIAADQIVFRVQILSASTPRTRPSVTIAGSTYSTWEYNYKGAYRITVGEFATVQEALAFRTECKNAGFNQAFVAAFRNGERETDPAVFKQ
jgi:hypothetical protein